MLSVRFRILTAQKVLLRKPPAPDKFYVHVLIAISHSRERLHGHPLDRKRSSRQTNRVAASNIRHSLYPRGAYQSFY